MIDSESDNLSCDLFMKNHQSKLREMCLLDKDIIETIKLPIVNPISVSEKKVEASCDLVDATMLSNDEAVSQENETHEKMKHDNVYIEHVDKFRNILNSLMDKEMSISQFIPKENSRNFISHEKSRLDFQKLMVNNMHEKLENRKKMLRLEKINKTNSDINDKLLTHQRSCLHFQPAVNFEVTNEDARMIFLQETVRTRLIAAERLKMEIQNNEMKQNSQDKQQLIHTPLNLNILNNEMRINILKNNIREKEEIAENQAKIREIEEQRNKEISEQKKKEIEEKSLLEQQQKEIDKKLRLEQKRKEMEEKLRLQQNKKEMEEKLKLEQQRKEDILKLEQQRKEVEEKLKLDKHRKEEKIKLELQQKEEKLKLDQQRKREKLKLDQQRKEEKLKLEQQMKEVEEQRKEIELKLKLDQKKKEMEERLLMKSQTKEIKLKLEPKAKEISKVISNIKNKGFVQNPEVKELKLNRKIREFCDSSVRKEPGLENKMSIGKIDIHQRNKEIEDKLQRFIANNFIDKQEKVVKNKKAEERLQSFLMQNFQPSILDEKSSSVTNRNSAQRRKRVINLEDSQCPKKRKLF